MSLVVAQPVKRNLKDLSEYFDKIVKEIQKIKSSCNYSLVIFLSLNLIMDELKRFKTLSASK